MRPASIADCASPVKFVCCGGEAATANEKEINFLAAAGQKALMRPASIADCAGRVIDVPCPWCYNAEGFST
jgi:hypothetical protein